MNINWHITAHGIVTFLVSLMSLVTPVVVAHDTKKGRKTNTVLRSTAVYDVLRFR